MNLLNPHSHLCPVPGPALFPRRPESFLFLDRGRISPPTFHDLLCSACPSQHACSFFPHRDSLPPPRAAMLEVGFPCRPSPLFCQKQPQPSRFKLKFGERSKNQWSHGPHAADGRDVVLFCAASLDGFVLFSCGYLASRVCSAWNGIPRNSASFPLVSTPLHGREDFPPVHVFIATASSFEKPVSYFWTSPSCTCAPPTFWMATSFSIQ